MGDSTNSMNVSGNTPLDEVRAGLNFNDADDHEDIQLKPGMIQVGHYCTVKKNTITLLVPSPRKMPRKRRHCRHSPTTLFAATGGQAGWG